MIGSQDTKCKILKVWYYLKELESQPGVLSAGAAGILSETHVWSLAEFIDFQL